MATMHVVRVTDDTTRAELVECIGLLNDAAKALSRRGKAGMLSCEYVVAHERIDALLADLERAET